MYWKLNGYVMSKVKVLNAVNNLFSSYKIFNILILLVYALILTFVLSSKYYLFQTIINPDNTSKKDITTQKTINVVDTYKTELLKKDAAQKIEPILTTADDTYIKNNYLAFVKSIESIRAEKHTNADKIKELNNLFDISNSSQKQYVVSFLITSSDDKFKAIIEKAGDILDKTLKAGITEKDFNNASINNLILKHSDTSVSKSQLSVISALLEQIIVPNMIGIKLYILFSFLF